MSGAGGKAPRFPGGGAQHFHKGRQRCLNGRREFETIKQFEPARRQIFPVPDAFHSRETPRSAITLTS